MRNTSSFLVN